MNPQIRNCADTPVKPIPSPGVLRKMQRLSTNHFSSAPNPRTKQYRPRFSASVDVCPLNENSFNTYRYQFGRSQESPISSSTDFVDLESVLKIGPPKMQPRLPTELLSAKSRRVAALRASRGNVLPLMKHCARHAAHNDCCIDCHMASFGFDSLRQPDAMRRFCAPEAIEASRGAQCINASALRLNPERALSAIETKSSCTFEQ